MNTGKGAALARPADERQSLPREFLLLQACATLHPEPAANAVIMALLAEGIDWTRFVQKAIDHGLAGLAGHTLSRIAPGMVPADILAAFGSYLEQTRIRNQALAREAVEIIRRLALAGIDAIPFKGPTMAQQVYGDLGFRVFRDLDFLVRDADYEAAVVILGQMGIHRHGGLTAAQYDMIHWIQGQEILRNETSGTMIEPHTRLTARKFALDIDHVGLWQRAQEAMFEGQPVKLFAPEDQFLMLAIHGGKELWWRMNWACDVAEFIRSQPALDWAAILERARAQGCLRITLLAGALARIHFGADIPDQVTRLANGDPALEPMLRSIQARWAADGLEGPPSGKRVSGDVLRLHDGAVRRARYVLRTWFLPAPSHVAALALGRPFRALYVPFKIFNDAVMLPVLKIYRGIFPVKKLPRARDA